jgi:fermentation-respiration switch protein FrsA (DUF1100 family)
LNETRAHRREIDVHLRPRWPTLGTQTLLLILATATWGLHVATETLFRAGHATFQERLEPMIVVSVLTAAAFMAFTRANVLAQASIAFLIAVLALANGAMHLYGLTIHRQAAHAPSPGANVAAALRDAGGVATLIAGTWLLGLAIVLLHRRRVARRSRPSLLWRRCARAGANIAVGLAVLDLVVFPVVLGTVQTHRLQHTSTGPLPPGYKVVELMASDGVKLSGWYHPSTNGAAVLLVPSASGTRDSVRAHADMLVKHGYGVLAYDARGSGASAGVRNAYGWGWGADVVGGVRFLSAQGDVRPSRIGAIGLSTGADVLIETVAARGDGGVNLSATVLDGATARSSGDLAPLERAPADALGNLPLRVTFGVISLLSGTRPGQPLRHLSAEAGRHGTPMFLVGAGSIPQEIPLNRRYAAAADARLWTLPDVAHTGGIHAGVGYEDRVIGFLDHALLGRSPEPSSDP